MDSASSKEKAIAFLEAHMAGDVPTAMALCAPDYEIITFAPIDLFPHLGQKNKGRDWLPESIRIQEERYSVRRFTLHNAIAEGDLAVLFTTMRLTKRSDDRVIEFFSSHTFTLQDGLILRQRLMFDSFSFVEQILGTDLSRDFAYRLRQAMCPPKHG